MPKMNGTGPEGHGPKTGRKLGNCKKDPTEKESTKIGKGLGKRRKSGGGPGKGVEVFK